MRFRMMIFTALLALAGTAFAATPPPAPATGAGPGANHQGPCERDPSKCAAEAAKFDQWCTANADKCVKLKAWAERRREKCEANKEKCEEMKQRMMQRHEERRSMKQNQAQPDEPGANNQPNDNEGQPDDLAPPPPTSA